MWIDQAGALWLSGPVALVVLIAAVLLVIWADSGLRVRPAAGRAQAIPLRPARARAGAARQSRPIDRTGLAKAA